MPNWCTTTYVFHGNNQEIEILHDTLQKATSSIIAKSDFGETWLGNIAYYINIQNEIDKTFTCRGTLDYIGEIETSSTDSHFRIDTQTAWAYDEIFWSVILTKLNLSSIKFSFYAEEESEDLLVIHDPHGFNDFTDAYKISYCLTSDDGVNEDSDYYTTDDAVKFLQSVLNTEINDIDELIDMIENKEFEDDDFVSVHKIDRI